MRHREMTDAEVRQQVERTDRFIAEFRTMVASTAVDPASSCAAEARSGLERIAATVDGVITSSTPIWPTSTRLCAATHVLIEVKLMCVGAGPRLDLVDAAAFLAEFNKLIDVVRKRYLH